MHRVFRTSLVRKGYSMCHVENILSSDVLHEGFLQASLEPYNTNMPPFSAQRHNKLQYERSGDHDAHKNH